MSGIPLARRDPNRLELHTDTVESRMNLEQLYRGQRPKLLRFLSRHTGSDAAQDIVQQAFAKLAALDEVRAGSIASPEAYLHRTADNLSRDAARVAQRRFDDFHVQADDVPLQSPDPVAALEARDMLRRLEVALLKMRQLTREIFMAHRLDGYTYAEIAGRTGLSVKGVEKQMSKAIAHLERAARTR